jgi:hypothetical protein
MSENNNMQSPPLYHDDPRAHQQQSHRGHPQCFNLWISSPCDVRHRILELSDPLTQYLNHHHPFKLNLGSPPDFETRVWESAFEMDWDGDLSILPMTALYNILDRLRDIERDVILKIKTRRMYNSLRKLALLHFPDLKFPFVHVLLRNCWHDLLLDASPFGFKDIELGSSIRSRDEQVGYFEAVKRMAIHGCHLDYLIHLEQISKQSHHSGNNDNHGHHHHHHHYQQHLDHTTGIGKQSKVHVGEFKVTADDWKSLMDSAARRNEWETLMHLHTHRAEGCTFKAMDFAAGSGYLRAVKFLHENRTEGCTSQAMDSASENGHLEVVKYLHENRMEGCTRRAMDFAAANGHLEVLEYLAANRSEGCSEFALMRAATGGWVGCVRFFVERLERFGFDGLSVRKAFLKTFVQLWYHEMEREGERTVEGGGDVVEEGGDGRFEVLEYLAGLQEFRQRADVLQSIIDFLFVRADYHQQEGNLAARDRIINHETDLQQSLLHRKLGKVNLSLIRLLYRCCVLSEDESIAIEYLNRLLEAFLKMGLFEVLQALHEEDAKVSGVFFHRRAVSCEGRDESEPCLGTDVLRQ